ncbi:serine protease 46-like [Ruditapes philippinarum]|uniref:serine protease 46-like n=1 Tax=Ruditapes philippinarum TaxID=129788 RepID=UPI00295B73D0|nr:serine protease 46-like [Ruditapes philippinarum]
MRNSFYILLAKLTLLVSCSSNDVETRLKNGQNVDKDMYSFVVKIELSGKQVCTGLLIDQQWILTLRRCIDKRSIAKYKVHIKDADTGKFISRKLKRSKELDEKNAKVILLELDIIIQTKVLSTNDLNGGSIDNKKETSCIVVGFTSNGNSLNKVKVDANSPKKCSGEACKKNLRFDTVHGADVCQSDNGAPVFCKIESKWFFTGMAVVKKGCQKKDILIVTLSHLSRSISKALKEERKFNLRISIHCYVM